MAIFQFLYLLPALIVIAIGFQVRSRWQRESAGPRWRQFLLIALAAQLLLMLVLVPTNLSFLLGPAVIGTSAAVLLLVNCEPRTWTRGSIKTVGPYLALIAALLILLQIASASLTVYLVIPAVFVPLIWRAYDWRGPWRWLAFLVLLAMLAGIGDVIPSALLARLPAWDESGYFPMAWVWPLVAVVLAARLVISILTPGRQKNWPALALYAILAGILLLTVLHQIVIYYAWDIMTDGLGSVMVITEAGWAAIAVAMVWSWRAQDWHAGTVPSFVFVLVVLVALESPILGNLPVSPVQMTAERAAQVNQAILRYQAQNGRYPDALVDLSPWYLWRVPDPIMIRDLTWCYESGANYYRLGYAYHEGFSARASVQVQGSAGMPPNPTWLCDEQVAQYNASAYIY